MKSLDALENIKTRTAPYFLGLYEKEDYIEDLKAIEEDLQILELFNKMHHNKRLSKKEVYALNKWLEEQDNESKR